MKNLKRALCGIVVSVLAILAIGAGASSPTEVGGCQLATGRTGGTAFGLVGVPMISVGSGHWIKNKIDGGKIIQLEDGSLWQVSPLDVIDSALWLPLENITVINGEDPMFPYKLINTDDHHSVNVKPLR